MVLSNLYGTADQLGRHHKDTLAYYVGHRLTQVCFYLQKRCRA